MAEKHFHDLNSTLSQLNASSTMNPCCPPNSWGALVSDHNEKGRQTRGDIIKLLNDLEAYTVAPESEPATKILILLFDM